MTVMCTATAVRRPFTWQGLGSNDNALAAKHHSLNPRGYHASRTEGEPIGVHAIRPCFQHWVVKLKIRLPLVVHVLKTSGDEVLARLI